MAISAYNNPRNGQRAPPDYKGARTVAQVLVGAGPDGMVPPGALVLSPVNTSNWFRKVRLMRRHPTLGFLRDLYMAALLAGEWSVECEHDEFKDAVKMVERSTVPFRIQFLRDALRGFLDFGWQPYEVVKELDEETGEFYVTKYKGLLQDLTQILVDYYGNLVGVRNMAIHNVINPNPVYLYRGDMCVLYRDAEGTNWYSEALMRRCERVYDSWIECDDGARRFDVKIAGSHWVVYYPEGTSVQRDPVTGTVTGEMDNAVIANNILNALSSSGKVGVPSKVLGQIDDLNNFDPSRMAWRVELLSPQTQQAQFVDRAKYLDSLMARGFGFPERAILEGQYGTKAEAEAHADFAIDNLEMTHRELMAIFNKQVINVLLELNRGHRYVDKVQLKASPLSDEKRAFLRKLYDQHWTNEAGQAQEQDAIDWTAIRDQLDVPVRSVKNEVPVRSVSAPAQPMKQQVNTAPSSRRARFMKKTQGRLA
jgi:hypothetical protein